MGALRRLVGLGLIAFAGWNLFLIFQEQIASELIQTQTTGFLDIFDPIIETATPEPTTQDIQKGILYGIVFIIGLVLLIR